MCLDNIYIKLKNLHNYVLFEDNVCSKCVRYIVKQKQVNANPTIQDRGSGGTSSKRISKEAPRMLGKFHFLSWVMGHCCYSLYLSYTLDNIFTFENVSRKRNTWWFLGDPGQIFSFLFPFSFIILCEKVLSLVTVKGGKGNRG